MALRMEIIEKQGVLDHVLIEDFLDVSSGFFWCLDETMRFSFVSEGVLGISGLEAVEHLGGGLDVLGYAWAGGDDPLEAREPFQDRLVWRGSATGERVWMHLAGKPVFRPGTGFAGFVGTGISAAVPETEDPLDDTGTPGWASGEAAGVWSLDHLAMFRDAMESLSDGFALFAADGRMMFCNGVYRKINENQPWVTDGPVTLEYIIKCNMELGLLEDAIGREEEFLAERMAHHREPRDGARLTRRTDGNVILIQEKKLADGCIALVNTDLTELSRREIALTEALAATERASRAKSDFLAQMSHEFRTPLNAIIGFSDLVLSETFGPVGSERYRTYIGDVKSSGEHLLSLINDLLDLTGIESGRREYDFEGLQPREIVSGALRAVRPIGQHAKIRLRGSTSRDLPIVKVDARSMHQCLLNLLSNAIRATRQGSRAILRSERHAPSLVAFSVTDTGCGISAGHVQHLLTGSGAKGDGYIADSGGTGLGLPITKSLIGVMGGRLDIESNIGEGTKVTLILPEA